MLGRLKYMHLSHSASEVQTTTDNLRRYKLTGNNDQIPAKIILSGGISVYSEIHKFISSRWNEEESYELWVKSLLYLFLRCGQRDCSNYQGISYHCYQLYAHFMHNYSLNIKSNAQRITGDNQCGFQHDIHS
jgi:hypothetical protein